MGVVTATITGEKGTMDTTFELLSIDILKEFNKIATAELRFIDGDIARQTFKVSEDEFFKPGKEIAISLKYEGKPKEDRQVFKGMVVNQSMELNGTQGTTLSVALCDEAVKMTTVRKNAVHAGSDKAIIENIIKTYEGREKGFIELPKVPEHTQMVQYYATDWDFIVSRAEANGYLVITDDGELSIVRPTLEKAGQRLKKLELGTDEILDLTLQVNGRDQVHEVSSVGWDLVNKKRIKSGASDEVKEAVLATHLPAMANVAGGEKVTQVHAVPMENGELKAWSDARVVKSSLSVVRGWIMIHGDARYKVGDTIQLKGVPQKFSDNYVICGVRHEVTEGGWVTHLQIGMDDDWLTSQSDVVATQSAGLLPGINGLQLGIVVALSAGDAPEDRVRVSIPAFGDGKEAVWARLASVDAGEKRGVFFRPKVGDEVVVGFFNDDPRQAVILGAMHSRINETPLPVTRENKQQGIFTKSGKLVFDEVKETVTLSTADKNEVVIDEKQGLISLKDANDNQVELSKEGIKIISAKNLAIVAEKDLSITAKGDVKIEGKKVDLI
ncbi:MAG: type VI secretion system tip protein VgrG [Bacteroidota bacterium]